jgi:hypothetical protein
MEFMQQQQHKDGIMLVPHPNFNKDKIEPAEAAPIQLVDALMSDAH